MAREWFTFTNTASDLDKADLAVLNRAARHLVNEGNPATHLLMMEVRMKYKRGMSAQDVIDAVNDAHFGFES